jgi:hypothetical protein
MALCGRAQIDGVQPAFAFVEKPTRNVANAATNTPTRTQHIYPQMNIVEVQ